MVTDRHVWDFFSANIESQPFWRFPKIGPQIIHLNWIFHEINHPAIGDPIWKSPVGCCPGGSSMTVSLVFRQQFATRKITIGLREINERNRHFHSKVLNSRYYFKHDHGHVQSLLEAKRSRLLWKNAPSKRKKQIEIRSIHGIRHVQETTTWPELSSVQSPKASPKVLAAWVQQGSSTPIWCQATNSWWEAPPPSAPARQGARCLLTMSFC